MCWLVTRWFSWLGSRSSFTSLGTVLFQRISVDHWQIVAGLVIGVILIGAIGVGVGRYYDHGVGTNDERTVWLLLQVAVLLGVLFYCSALKSWMLRKLQENAVGRQGLRTTGTRNEINRR